MEENHVKKVVVEKGRTMTRQDVIKLFPDATEEQITNLLNAHHKDVDAEKEKAKASSKDSADKVAELQAQLEALQNKDTPEIEKIQKQLEKMTADYDKAQKTIKDMELKNNLIGQGVSGEDADKLIEQMSAEKFDASVIGTIINNAISAHDKDRMQNTPDPTGGNGAPDTKSDAEKIAESMYSGSSEQKQSVISNYL